MKIDCQKLTKFLSSAVKINRRIDDILGSDKPADNIKSISKSVDSFRGEMSPILLETKYYNTWKHYETGEIITKVDRSVENQKQEYDPSRPIWESHPKGVLCGIPTEGVLNIYLNPEGNLEVPDDSPILRNQELFTHIFQSEPWWVKLDDNQIWEPDRYFDPFFQVNDEGGIIYLDDGKLYFGKSFAKIQNGDSRAPWGDGVVIIDFFQYRTITIIHADHTEESIPFPKIEDNIEKVEVSHRNIIFEVEGYIDQKKVKSLVNEKGETLFDLSYAGSWKAHTQGFITFADGKIYLNGKKEIYNAIENLDFDFEYDCLVHPDGVVIYDWGEKAWIFYGEKGTAKS
ncbi:MAG: hypothetical protein NTW50_05330 [Candidatus Berkelbacteria bacterium]|nr:hypothetical protein [Candidatus Berkelbacteria bacterium]